MKFFGKHMSETDALLTTEGTLGVAAGLVMICEPKEAMDKVFDKSKDKSMTRIAGASLAAASTYAMRAGYCGTPGERRTAYSVVATHSAIGAGLGLTQLAGKSNGMVMDKDKLKFATALLAANSLFFAMKAARSKSIV